MNRALVVLLCFPFFLPAADNDTLTVPLTVPAGAPLRLFLTKRVSKKTGVAVEAKVMDPVFAFDREVIPAGSTVLGDVNRTRSIPRFQRFQAIAGGDFTPLHRADVEFTTLLLPDGRKFALRTEINPGLNSIYVEPSHKKPKPAKSKPADPSPPAQQNSGILGLGKSTARQQLNAQLNSRTRGVADLVRGPNKKERLVDFLMAKLPYHPQYLRRGTRFDAPLLAPLDFGTVSIPRQNLTQIGTQPPPDSSTRARLLTPLDSSSAKVGERVEAVVTAPLFSPEHKLIVPEGTKLTGTVVVAQKARMFHRGGKLRFTFQKVELGQAEEMRTQAIVGAAENSGKAQIKVDSEGEVQVTESKTRLLAPLISLAIANKGADADAGKRTASGGAEGNVSGRTLAGGLGLGMIGSLVAQSSKYVGMAFGYYGLACSVYTNLVSRGGEVEFEKNALLDIKFGARPTAK